MVDYSRFDHIGSDSDSGDDGVATAVRGPSAAPTALRPPSATASAVATLAAPARDGSDSGGSGKGKGAEGAKGDNGASFTQPVMMTASKKGREGRIKFEHEGVL